MKKATIFNQNGSVNAEKLVMSIKTRNPKTGSTIEKLAIINIQLAAFLSILTCAHNAALSGLELWVMMCSET